MTLTRVTVAAALLALCAPPHSYGRAAAPPITGRWDLTVHGARGDYPSWVEISESGGQLAGRFVGQVGSARPIKQITYSGEVLTWSLPPQFEGRGADLQFQGKLAGERLEGTTTRGRGESKWEGRRAPSLRRAMPPPWGEPVTLFNGKDLAGWHARSAARKNGWTARGGNLYNETPGNDLVTDRKFTDVRLHAEYRYPAESNSGIYLRGRYEFQIDDDSGRPAGSHGSGGIYGFLAPRVNAARRAGEWQSCDITLVGRRVSATLNGEKILDNQEIPGITGGALDSDEGAPGPLLIQGDHGPIEFRNIVVTPAR